MKIPVRNLYYLFAYAWAKFPAGEAVDVGDDECPDVLNLFAKLLVEGLNRLIRRGLDWGYVPHVDTTRAPRGRLLLDDIVKQQTLLRGEIVCTYDELVHDVIHNQILKATARLLAKSDGVVSSYRHELRLLVQKLDSVSNIRLTASCFRRVQLSRNSRQYAMLMQLCEFVFQSLMPESQGDGAKFADILTDEIKMSAIFEEFLRNFYRHTQKNFTVDRDTMAWDAVALNRDGASYLPIMHTDITLRSSSRVIVVDAKYYRKTLSQFHGGSKIHSTNLYQLFTYLKHSTIRYPGVQCDGALIYPAVDAQLCHDYDVGEHRIRVATVDLARPWKEIHEELIGVLFHPYGDAVQDGQRRNVLHEPMGENRALTSVHSNA